MASINALSVALFNAAAGGYAAEMAGNTSGFANTAGPILEKDLSTDALFVEHLLGNLGVAFTSPVYAQAKAAVAGLVTAKGRAGAAIDAIDFLKAQEGGTSPYAVIAATFAAKVNQATLFTAANSTERDITKLISGVTGVDTDVAATNVAVAAAVAVQKAADDAAAAKAAADAAAVLKAAQDKAAADLSAANTAAAAAAKVAADAATAAAVKAAADAATAAATLKAAQDAAAAAATAAAEKAELEKAAAVAAVDKTTDNAAAVTAALKAAALDLGVTGTSAMTDAELITAIKTVNDTAIAAAALAAVNDTTYASEQAAFDAAKKAGDDAAKVLQAKIDALQVQLDASKAITYAVTATATSVNEGATATFIIQTTGLTDGASLSYTVSDSISTAGRVSTTSGTAKVDSSGVALVTVPVTANSKTDGAGTLTLALINGKASKAIDIADTSQTQTTWTITATEIASANLQNSPINVAVGNTGAQTVNLATDAVTATRGFTVTGNGDITVTSGLSNDTITVGGNGANTINTGAGNDTVVVSGTGNNIVNVGAGDDNVTTGTGNDTIRFGSGALGEGDFVTGGDGTDTVIISGDGNVITNNAAGTGAVLSGVENVVLDGTTVTINSLVALQALKSIQGSSTTSEITVSVATGDTVDLTGLSLTTIKSLTFAANSGSAVAVTVKADAADLAALGSVLKTNAGAGAVTVGLSVDVEGYKALNATTDTAFTGGTVTVSDTVDNLIANKTLIASATKVVSGTITGADALKLSQAGVTASLTSTMSVAEALKTLQYPDQVAALAGSKLKITGNATYAEYAAIAANSTLTAAVVAAYSASTGGYKGIAIADTTANLAAAASTINTAITANKIGAVAINGGAALSVSNASTLTGITGVTGTYSVSDTAAAVNGEISSPSSIGALLTNASSVSLTTGNREVATVAAALELKALGSKLTGGFDVAISTTDALTTNGLSAVSGAKKATLTGTVSVTQLNQILAANSAATVTAVSDNAQNLVAGVSKLSAVTTDLLIEGTVTVTQAAEIQPALKAILAKTGVAHTTYGVSGSTYTNGYAISDVSSAVLGSSNAAAVKGAKAVTVTNAITLSDATALKAVADVVSDELTFANTTYSVTDSASALATALSNTVTADKQNTVDVLGKASTVTATGVASVAQAKVLGTAATPTGGSSGVQVDTWAISDTVAKLFPSGSLSGDIDANTDAALVKATALSVQGDVTVAQMAALKLITTGLSGNALIFDNVYALKDSASNVATQAGTSTTPLTSATSISLTDAAVVSNLAGLVTLNTALTTAGKANVSYALTDTIANVTGSTALGSSTPSVVASAKAASLITVTGDFTGVTAASLLDLADKAGTANYTVEVTEAATTIASTAAGLLNNSKISKISTSSELSVSQASTLLTAVGTAVTTKVVYNLQDNATNLIASAANTTVLGAKNITAYDSGATQAVTVAVAQQLLNLTGASGTVTYKVDDTYANVSANTAVASGAEEINVDNTTLTVSQYANLLNIAGTVTVASEAIKDSAAAVSSASKAVLAATSGVTLTDVGTLNLNAEQAVALVASGNAAYKIASSSGQPGAAAVVVNVNDTTANLLLLKAAATTGTASERAITDATVVKATDVATLSGANATTLLSFASTSKFNLSDTAANLANGSVISTSNLGKASSVTVTGESSLADAVTVNTYATGVLSVSEITASSVGTSSSGLIKSSGSGSSLVYDYASLFAKTGKITLSSAGNVAGVTSLKVAAGTTAISFSLSDTAENLASTAGQALLNGATGLAFSSGVATAKEAATLASYVAKFSSGFAVTDTASALIDNLSAAKSALGTVTVGSGTTSVAQYSTLKGTLGAALSSTSITDTAATLADFLIAGSTAGGYTIAGSTAVSAAQAKALAAASVAVSSLKITDSAESLLALGDAFGTVTTATASGTVDLATAKQLAVAFETTARFDVATTADRFVAAYSDSTATDLVTANTANLVDVLKMATTITVDGTAVTLGIQNASLIAGARSTYNGKIVGTVEQINALPAALKAAAGYVVVDTLANITSPANTALIASGSGYVVKDSAANITAAGSSVLQTVSGALGIQVDDAISVATLGTILANTNTDSYVKYSLADSAANLVSGGSAVTGVSDATNVTVTGAAATAAQAKAIFTAKSTAVIDSVVDTVTGITALSALGTGTASINAAKSITIDGNLSTAGLQGIGASDASTIVTNKGAASLTFNISDTATNVVNSSYLTAVNAAGSITVDTSSTAATAAQAKTLASFANVVSGYTVTDSASNLTTATTVGLADLAKAGVVKVTSGSSGTASVAQANILLGLGNIEKGTGSNAALANFAITDTAKALASADAAKLQSVVGTVTVSNYTATLTAAEATSLAAVDAASSKLSTTAASVKVSDTSANILATANATAIAAVGSIDITDAVTVSQLNQVRTVGGTANSEVYTYKLLDSATNLIVSGTATMTKAAEIKVTGTTSVADMGWIAAKAADTSTSGYVTTTVSYDVVSGTDAQLFGTLSSGLLTNDTDLSTSEALNSEVAANASVIRLTGSAAVSRIKLLKADSNFDGVYAVGDTAANLVAAINGADKSILSAATSVGLATGQAATVVQATMIASQLTNESALALSDTATAFNAATAADTVATAASLKVNAGNGNDAVTNATAAKVTYYFNDLGDMVASGAGWDVLTLKTGDVLDLSGITDWDGAAGGNPGWLTLDANSTFIAGEYIITRGYYSDSDGFVANANGNSSLLSIHTDGTTGVDESIVLVGVTSLTTITNGTAGQVIGFTAG